MYRYQETVSNKYLIIGISFSIVTMGFFFHSASQFLEHQKCFAIWDKHPDWLGPGRDRCDEFGVSSHNDLTYGIGTSAVAITMLVIFFKKW